MPRKFQLSSFTLNEMPNPQIFIKISLSKL